MPVNDTVADMLTRIRNASLAQHKRVVMPNTKIIAAIAEILKEEGFVRNVKVTPGKPQGTLQIDLKYTSERHPEPVIGGLKRISKPGRRIYTQHDKIPWVRSGLGIAILSTSKGVVSDRKARELGIGGELLCYVW
ncbi:MAG: 30S ribosomal protein S8 [Chloroflexota bacterium]